MVVKVIAFTKDGYHKEIAVLDADQLRMHDARANDQAIDIVLAGPGVGIAFDLTDFPEVTRFVVKVTK